MRADRATTVGQRGELEVAAELAAFGWGPVRTELGSDLGTDIYAQIRDDSRYDVGLLLSFQVKTGASRFRREATLLDIGPGWWHEEQDYEHFESWVQHSIPHILILRDSEAGVSYWAHVNRDSVTSMDRGTKLFVPRSQTLDHRHRDKLASLAASQREAHSIEGTAWRAATGKLYSPANGMRTALLCPRLVAPHENQPPSTVTPEEVVALCIVGRAHQLRHYLRLRNRAPRTVEEMGEQQSFKWRFASQIYLAAQGVDFHFPVELVEAAPNAHSRVAAGVLAAVSMLREERVTDAINLLERISARTSPVDRAWLLTQRARALLLNGQDEAAVIAADRAQQATSFYADDLTASAIAGATASIKLAARASITSEGVEEAVRRGDNAAAWWRAQTTTAGLAKWTERAFKRQFHSRSVTLGGIDTPFFRLRGAAWLADFAGDDASWRGAAALYASYLLSSRESAAYDEIGLDLFRRSGDHKRAELAAKYLWRFGPTEPLESVASRFHQWSWCRGTLRANLAVMAHGADLIGAPQRRAAVQTLGEVLRSADTARFAIEDVVDKIDVLKALREVVRVSYESETQELAGRLVLDLLCAASDDDPSLPQLGEIASVLEVDLLTEGLVDEFDAFCRASSDPQVTADLLSLLRRHARVGEAAQAALVARAGEGDVNALRRTPRDSFRGAGGADDAPELIERQVEELAAAREAAARGAFYDEPAAAYTLALLSADYPEHARWQELIDYISDSNLPREWKREACTALSTVAGSIPDESKALLSDAVIQLDSHGLEFGIFGRLAGEHIQLLAALGQEPDATVASRITTLLQGEADERANAAAAASYWSSPIAEGLLIALASDQHVSVRANAIGALLRRRSEVMDLSAFALQTLSNDEGVSVPMQIVQGWASGEFDLGNLNDEVLEEFAEHKSASVRMNANRILQSLGVHQQ